LWAIPADVHQPESATGSPSSGGHFVRTASKAAVPAGWGEGEMRSEDLMSPDLLSEIVLLGFGTLMLASLLVFVMTALTRT